MNLPIVSCAEMRRIEEKTISGGVPADSLMEEVGRQVAHTVLQFVPRAGVALVYYGKGHNGGDALVAARHLASDGWEIELRPQERDESKLAELTRMKLENLQSSKPQRRVVRRFKPQVSVILDGLLGIGSEGPLRDEIRALTREINARREEGNARVFAIDVPTGLNADTGAADPDCVVADVTVTAGYAKSGLVADGAAAFVGRLCVAPLEEFAAHAGAAADGETATPESLQGLLARRNFDSHKTQYGRVGIVAGSPGFTGAAVMCASGALRAGAGLVTIYAPEEIERVLSIAAPPEVMVRPVKSYVEVTDEKHDVLAVGPGLGRARAGAILDLIEQVKGPMVLDADGLNIVAEHDTGVLRHCAGIRLLTPHPGEMARMFPEATELSRVETVKRFTERFSNSRVPLTVLLKGSRTVVYEQGRTVSYNTTGNPGMGTGGMGDVLTGVCAALVGQRLSLYDAARVGAWLCGRAAELAVQARSEESLAAMDVVQWLGGAFLQLRGGGS